MIALFGGKGYLGRQISHYLSQRRIDVDVFDLPECDVAQAAFWDRFELRRYKAIVFFAGVTGTEAGFVEAERYLASNELGLLRLLMKSLPLGSRAPRIVFPSSRLVYRGCERALEEDDEKEAKTVYAVNKLACENYLQAYFNRFGIPYNVLRICVPYGNLVGDEYSYGTIGFFRKQIKEGKPITLYGDGKALRTFTHVEDICRAVEQFIATGKSGIYNMGGCNMSMADAAKLVAEKYCGAEVRFVDWPKEALLIESGSTMFSGRKIARDFHFKNIHKLSGATI